MLVTHLSINRPLLCALCVIFLYLRNETISILIEIEVGKTFDVLCPAKHYVSGITITRETHSSNQTDFRFSIECHPLISDVLSNLGEEQCIRSEHFGLSWSGGVKGSERRIQLICCKASNVLIDNDRCGYTGMESLLGSPWRQSVLGTARVNGKGKQAVIQGIILNENYVNSRVCQMEPRPSGKTIDSGNCYEYRDCKDDGTRSSHQSKNGYQTCDQRNEPFGWPETMTYMAGDSLATYSKNQLYQKQEFVCRTGQRVVSIGLKRRNAQDDDKQHDYLLSAKCSSNGELYPCYCYWMNNCPNKGVNEFYGNVDSAWYVGGIRSWWDTNQKQRKMGFLCCRTNSLKILDCSSSASMSASKNSQWSSDDKQGENGEASIVSFIRGAEPSYDRDGVTLKITSCTGSLTYGWCSDDYDAQCRRCARRGRQSSSRRLPEANGNGQRNSNANGHSHSGINSHPEDPADGVLFGFPDPHTRIAAAARAANGAEAAVTKVAAVRAGPVTTVLAKDTPRHQRVLSRRSAAAAVPAVSPCPNTVIFQDQVPMESLDHLPRRKPTSRLVSLENPIRAIQILSLG